jgi:hypothetical protein
VSTAQEPNDPRLSCRRAAGASWLAGPRWRAGQLQPLVRAGAARARRAALFSSAAVVPTAAGEPRRPGSAGALVMTSRHPAWGWRRGHRRRDTGLWDDAVSATRLPPRRPIQPELVISLTDLSSPNSAVLAIYPGQPSRASGSASALGDPA